MSQAPNKCTQCGKCFSTRANFERHAITHTTEKPFNCSHCDKAFNFWSKFERHAITHTTEKPYNCSHCDKAFNNWSNCQRHEVEVHKAAKPRDSSIKKQDVHLKRVRANSHKCQLCRKCFRYPSELERHALRTHGKKLYRCQHCSKCFRFPSDWKRHLRTHRNNMCQPCKKYFKNAGELKRHNNRNHGAENSFKCKECDKCFSDSSSLQLHEKSHTKCSQRLDPNKCLKPYNCDQSGKCFNQANILKQHKRTHMGEDFNQTTAQDFTDLGMAKPSWQSKGTYQYAEEKPYKCKKCTECFFQVCDLTKHQRRKHAGDDCNQSAAHDIRGRAAAKTSRQGKITEKPHRCTECNKGFFRAWDLKKHHKTKHVAGHDCIQSTAKDIACLGKAKTSQRGKGPYQYVAGKPYKCTECNKGFFRAWDLKRHHRTKHVAGHDCIQSTQSTALDIAGLGKARTSQRGKEPYQYVAGKPYKCTECNKCFFRAWELKRHHRRRHVAGDDCIQSKAKELTDLGEAKTLQHKERLLTREIGNQSTNRCHPETLQQSNRTCTTERPHKCKQCYKGFPSRSKLKRHEMIHQKRMPFKCKYCDRGFKALVNCSKHEQTLHQGGKSSEDCSQSRSQRAQRGTPGTTELHSDGSRVVKYFCHPSSVQDDKSSEAECWICLEEFSSHALLLEHIDNHMESI